MRPTLPLLLLALLPAFALAQEEGDMPHLASGPVTAIDPAKTPPRFASVAAKLHPQHGAVTIGGGLATVNLPEELAYLPADETDIYMREIVGYPRTIRTLGSLIPSQTAIGSPAGWNALIAYREDGHIDAEPARTLDASDLMAKIMQSNKDRLRQMDRKGYQGYGIRILGWAEAPFYNASGHTLTWALHTQPRGSQNDEINYHIDYFGRKGVLSFIIVAPLEQLPMLQGMARKIATIAAFAPGHGYNDFNPKTDPSAPYGVTDIVRGRMNVKPAPNLAK